MTHGRPKTQRPQHDRLTTHLARMRAGADVDTRADVATDVAGLLNAERLGAPERQLALDILERLVHDVEAAVRAAVGEQLCQSPHLPPAWAKQLARDIAPVAVPVLRYAEVLTDADLIAVAALADPEKLHAISARRIVGEPVSAAVVEHGDASVTAALLDNPGAQMSDATLAHAFTRFPDETAVQRGLLERRLPGGVLVALAARASAEVKRELVDALGVPDALCAGLVQLSEEATLDLILALTETCAVDEALVALHHAGKLSDTFHLRALLEGHVVVFVRGLSVRTMVSVEEVERRIWRGSAFERGWIYHKGGFRKGLASAFNAAIASAAPYVDAGQCLDSAFQRQAARRIAAQYRDVPPTPLNGLLEALDRFVTSNGA
jgi:uncharacterized protein (DUF2336 family)